MRQDRGTGLPRAQPSQGKEAAAMTLNRLVRLCRPLLPARSHDGRAAAPGRLPSAPGFPPPTPSSPRWNMRTQMLGRTALWLGAMALLGGAGAARAQYPSGYAGYGYGYGYPAAGQYAGYGQSAYAYYPGYGYYPNYGYSYPNYNTGQQSYQPRPATAYTAYPEGTSQGAAQAAPQAAYPSGSSAGWPYMPLGPEEIPGDDPPPPAKAAAAEAAHRDRFWFAAGYDSSWIKPWKLTTPLATTGSATPPPGVDPATYHIGGLGQPSTSVLIGDRVEFGRFDGVRLAAGVYLDDADHWAAELIGQYQIANSERFAANSDPTGDPVITRPIFNVVNGVDRAFFDSLPGIASGGISVIARSQLMGAETNMRYFYCPSEHVHLDALAGFRFLRLGEDLTIRDHIEPLAGSGVTFETAGLTPGQTLADVDSFKTVNHFYGIQLGGGATWEGKYLFANAYGKVGLGVTDQEVDINGSTTLNTGSGSEVAGGGILALPTNIGHHTRTELGFVPEGGLNVGVKVWPCVRLTAGYSFTYWNSVVRPGAQIDRGVNPSQVPTDVSFGQASAFGGPLRPAFGFNSESYWIHTLNLSLDIHY